LSSLFSSLILLSGKVQFMKTKSIKVLYEALKIAAREMYEIILNQLENSPDRFSEEVQNKEKWINEQVESWIENAETILRLRQNKH